MACDLLGLWSEDEVDTFGRANVCGVDEVAVEWWGGQQGETGTQLGTDGGEVLAAGPMLKSIA